MANQFYESLLNLAVGKTITGLSMPDFDSDTLKADLIDLADYTVDVVNHQDYADIPAAAKMTTNGTATLANVTAGSVAAGVVDCDNIVWTGVNGDQAEYVVVYQDTGTASTSPLIGIWDTTNTGLPVSPSGGDITAVISGSGLLKL